MKKLLFFILLLLSFTGFSQTLTKKYNNLNNRYEYFNSQGVMVGYQYYDSLDNSWKYYELPQKQQNSYVQPVNIDLVNKALTVKQNRYNNNVAKVQEAIDNIGNSINELDVDENTRKRILNRFDRILESLNNSRQNYASTTTTNNVINWLYNEINKAIKTEITVKQTYPRAIGKYVTLKRKAVMWDIPSVAKSKNIGEMQTFEVYVIEKTNDTYYKVNSGGIIGYITASNFKHLNL